MGDRGCVTHAAEGQGACSDQDFAKMLHDDSPMRWVAYEAVWLLVLASC